MARSAVAAVALAAAALCWLGRPAQAVEFGCPPDYEPDEYRETCYRAFPAGHFSQYRPKACAPYEMVTDINELSNAHKTVKFKRVWAGVRWRYVPGEPRPEVKRNPYISEPSYIKPKGKGTQCLTYTKFWSRRQKRRMFRRDWISCKKQHETLCKAPFTTTTTTPPPPDADFAIVQDLNDHYVGNLTCSDNFGMKIADLSGEGNFARGLNELRKFHVDKAWVSAYDLHLHEEKHEYVWFNSGNPVLASQWAPGFPQWELGECTYLDTELGGLVTEDCATHHKTLCSSL